MVGTALIAGIFTVLGAGVTLLYEAVSGHNAHRREDRWRCIDATAELTAAAYQVMQQRQAAHPGVAANPGEPPSDPFNRFAAAYARLVLAVPKLSVQLNQIRTDLLREDVGEDQFRALLDTFLADAARTITFPVFTFLPGRSPGPGQRK
jgi:hypothetical protein